MTFHKSKGPNIRDATLKACTTGFLLAFLAANAVSCSKPESPVDGKPVTISPLSKPRDVNKIDTQTSDNTKRTPLVGLRFSLEDFESGKWDGTFEQERCADGLRTSLQFSKTSVVWKEEVFDDAECKAPVESVTTTYLVKKVSENALDLKPTQRKKQLFLEEEVNAANDPENPMCAIGWTKASSDAAAQKTGERDISKLGSCYLEEGLYTSLAWKDENTLVVGSSSRDPKTGEMRDGETPVKRMTELEQLPFKKKP
jgi:hypothetical protein